MYQIFFTKDEVIDYACAKHSDPALFAVYFHELLRKKVFIPPSQFETCFVSTAHTEDDLKFSIGAFDSALEAVSKARLP
jgi:glutamate-1-semialdehyde 2,1-aminomutase